MMNVEELKEKILSGESITKDEAIALESAEVEGCPARRRDTPAVCWRRFRRLHDNQREERPLYGKLQILRAVRSLPLRR